MLHIHRRHNAFGCEDARIVSREAIEQASLSATCDYHAGESVGSDLVEEFLCSRHFRSRGKSVENLALALIHEFNFLTGKRVDEVNKMAELGTLLAHVDGGVPNMRVVLPELNEYYLGQLIYFFERACGVSGLLLDVNPFNQPGVEAYKKNMFALLGKPGYEAETEAIQARLK